MPTNGGGYKFQTLNTTSTNYSGNNSTNIMSVNEFNEIMEQQSNQQCLGQYNLKASYNDRDLINMNHTQNLITNNLKNNN
jgi:hypothetical protein